MDRISVEEYRERYKNKSPGNRRVKNATPSVTQDGKKTPSTLEARAYDMFKAAGLMFEFQKRIVLQKRMSYRDKVVRPIEWIPDFIFTNPDMIVDTKGYKTDVFKIKAKMFKYERQLTPVPIIILPDLQAVETFIYLYGGKDYRAIYEYYEL